MCSRYFKNKSETFASELLRTKITKKSGLKLTLCDLEWWQFQFFKFTIFYYLWVSVKISNIVIVFILSWNIHNLCKYLDKIIPILYRVPGVHIVPMLTSIHIISRVHVLHKCKQDTGDIYKQNPDIPGKVNIKLILNMIDLIWF